MFVNRVLFLLTLINSYLCVSQNVNNNTELLLSEQFLNNETVLRVIPSLVNNSADAITDFHNVSFVDDSSKTFPDFGVTESFNGDKNVSYLNSTFPQNNYEKVWENLIKYGSGKENVNSPPINYFSDNYDISSNTNSNINNNSTTLNTFQSSTETNENERNTSDINYTNTFFIKHLHSNNSQLTTEHNETNEYVTNTNNNINYNYTPLRINLNNSEEYNTINENNAITNSTNTIIIKNYLNNTENLEKYMEHKEINEYNTKENEEISYNNKILNLNNSEGNNEINEHNKNTNDINYNTTIINNNINNNSEAYMEHNEINQQNKNTTGKTDYNNIIIIKPHSNNPEEFTKDIKINEKTEKSIELDFVTETSETKNSGENENDLIGLIDKKSGEKSQELIFEPIKEKSIKINNKTDQNDTVDQNLNEELNLNNDESEMSRDQLNQVESGKVNDKTDETDENAKFNYFSLNQSDEPYQDKSVKLEDDLVKNGAFNDRIKNDYLLNDIPDVAQPQDVFRGMNNTEIWELLTNNTNSSGLTDDYDQGYHNYDRNTDPENNETPDPKVSFPSKEVIHRTHFLNSSNDIVPSDEAYKNNRKDFANVNKIDDTEQNLDTEDQVTENNNLEDLTSSANSENIMFTPYVSTKETYKDSVIPEENYSDFQNSTTTESTKINFMEENDLSSTDIAEYSVNSNDNFRIIDPPSSSSTIENSTSANLIKITSDKTEASTDSGNYDSIHINETVNVKPQNKGIKSSVFEYQNDNPDVSADEESGVTLAFVFDATGSMWDDLVQVREGATKIMQAMLERPDKPIYDYVLVTFRDPDIGVPLVTRDHARLKQELDNIQVIGGMDCPEMSIGAVKLALEASRPNSYIYVFTDASAKDYALIDEVLPLIQEKLSKVVFVMTGDCGSPNHPGYLVYQRIASTSSGQVYHLEKSHINEVLDFIRLSLPHKPQKVNLLSVDHISGPTSRNSKHNLSLPVDKSLSEFTVSVSGRKASLGVLDPYGALAVPPKLTEMLNLENVKVISVKEPDPGLWTLKVGSDSQYTVRSTGLSSSDFGYGFASSPAKNKDETSLRPLKGSPTNLLVWATDPNNLQSFKRCELIGTNGKIYKDLLLEPAEGQNGLYRTITFVPPDEFFYLTVHGISTDGHEFKRITPTAIASVKPERAGISAVQVVEAQANQPASLSCYVKSLLPFGVRWMKNGARIGKMQHYLQTAHVSWDFAKVSKADEGSYICRVNNSAGLSHRQIRLIVKGDPPVIRFKNEVKVSPGSMAVLDCAVESAIPYNVSWKKFIGDGVDKVDLHTWIENDQMSVLENNSLVIEEAGPEDVGWYVCIADSDGGSSTSDRIHLFLQEKPEVVVYPENKEFAEGGSFTLNCIIVKGIPEPVLTWEKDGISIEGDRRFQTEVVNNTLELKLSNGRRTDEGLYRCVGRNEGGLGYSSARVIILRQPAVVVEGQKEIIVNGTTTGMLHCKVSEVPAYNISWIRGDVSPTPDVWNKKNVKVLNNDAIKYRIHRNGSLEIFSLNPTDQGWYSCCAEYKGYIGTNGVYLTVKEVPNVSLEEAEIKFQTGVDLKIKCFINAGFPTPSVLWFKNGRPISSYDNRFRIYQENSTSILTISQSRKEDIGNYECRATNNHGVAEAEAAVVYTEFPKITSYEKRKLVKEGDRAILSCDVSGEPKPHVRWFKNSKEVMPSSGQESHVVVYNNSLHISSVDKNSDGVYSCHAENSVGSAEDYITLEVGSIPVIATSPNSTEIEIEQTGSLYCEATGFPKPTITWTRKNEPTPLDKEHFTITDYGRLLVKGVSLNDQGVYVCTAENIFGRATYETRLAVTGIEPPVLERNQNTSMIENGFDPSGMELKRVAPGKSVEFNCHVSQGRPKPTLNWYFNGRPLTSGKGGYYFGYENGSLIIPYVTNNLDGIYECVISNAVGIDRKYIKLETFTPPVIHGSSTNVRAIVGRSLELECNATGDPQPDVRWQRFGNDPLPVGQINPNSGSYIIRNVSESDEGSYVCIADNIAGSANWATSLTVIVPAKVVSLPLEVFIMEGQVIELDCETAGKPQPAVKWIKDNLDVSSVAQSSSDRFLRFMVTSSDAGIYSCFASNIAGTDMKNVTVVVLVPPRIINGREETVQVIEGTDLQLKCDAFGFPPPVIFWHYKEPDHAVIPDSNEYISIDGATLTIRKASVNISGVYVCDAENTAGIAQKIYHLDVLVLPKILDTFPPVINLTVGDDYPLPCRAIGSPTPSVFWQKGKIILRPGQQLGNLVVMMDNTLVLWNATSESSGTYACTAYNPAGAVSRNHTFNVLAAPVLMDSNVTRVEIQETNAGLLTCPVAAAHPPASVIWLKDGKAVDFKANERADDVHFYTMEGGRTLNIVEARSTDIGVYTCIAQNPAGVAQAKFTVDVTAPPDFVNQYPELNFVVNQGESVTFDCVVLGNPVPRINWHNLEKNLPITPHTTPGATFDATKQKLTITSAKPNHNGKYRCSVFNTLDTLQRTFRLTVVGTPEIEGAAEETLELIVGEYYNLVCSISGSPIPKYSWYFNSSRSSEKELLDETSDLLKLKNVTLFSNGTYTCVANNTAGSQIKNFIVKIIGPPTIEGSDFVEDIKVKSSENLKLSCVVIGAPKPTITWLRNGLITKGLSVDADKKVINNTYSVTLPALNGKYSCMASNKGGVAEKQFNVKVLVAPQWVKQREYFSNDQLQPVEGQPLKIKCPVNGNPPPEIYWLFNGIPINGSEVDRDTIEYDSSESRLSGNYTCFAVNHAGNFSKTFKVDILVPPTFLNKEDVIDFRVPINTTVKFNCSVSGNPVPRILWLKGFATLPSKNSSEILELESVSVDDSGDYSCLASNSAGDAEKSFRLQVLEPPAMDEENTVPVFNLTVKLHRRVAIKCPLNGVPIPNITWHKNGKVITSDIKNMVEISQDGRQLQIMHAVAEDAGSYRCVAENQAGIKELLFDLTVVVPLEWSEWANWGTCNVSCGGGEQERKRYCGGISNGTKEIIDSVSSPLVVLDKSNCLGDNVQHRKCNIAPCQMDDGWTEWSNWTSCSATCGESKRQRVRECRTSRPALDGLPCIGPSVQHEPCLLPECSYWGEWSEWSECSAKCDYGTKFRERKCSKPDGVCNGQYREIVACNTQKCPVNGNWSEWGEWSMCSVTCGRGIRRRNRICIRPKFGGKRCDGDNLEIQECRMIKCHRDIPKRANLAIRGQLNGEHIKPTTVSAEIKKFRGKRVVSASVDDMLKKQAGWFPYLTFLLPSVNWNVAEEEGATNNGYSLTDGNFEQESKFQFATGHELFVDSKGRGINPKSGVLEVDIEVVGEIPLAQPKSAVFVEPFTEDFVQTDKNKLFASSNSTIDVDGELVPYEWNKTVSYNTELGTMPYLVERLSTDEIQAEYDARNHKVHYSAATSISSPYEKDTCPKGFSLDERYQHCKDIDECKDKSHKCHKSQICENLFGSYKCHCPTGFQLSANGKRCSDINECEMHRDKCSHFCVNTKGSYKCSCPGGMTLGSDQKTCYGGEYGSNQDYSAYSDGYTADDWNGNDQMLNSNFRQGVPEFHANYYEDLIPQRRTKVNDYNKYEEFQKPPESWACPPGRVKEGNKCVASEIQTKGHCTIDRCSEYETCLPTYSGHLCVQTRCPVKYHRDYRTKKCIQFCKEGVCVNGASESEEIMFIPLPLEITSVQRYQDLIELSIQGATSGVVFSITENLSNLPLRVRIENGHGVLYSLKYFDVEGVQKVVVVAITYDKDNVTPVFVNTFIIFLYDPSVL